MVFTVQGEDMRTVDGHQMEYLQVPQPLGDLPVPLGYITLGRVC